MVDNLKKFSRLMEDQEYNQAQVMLKKHQTDLAKYFAEDHPGRIAILNNQAMLCKLQGDYIKATDLYHQVSLKYEAVFGRTHPLYLNSLAAYGACLLEVKELETAAGVFDKLVKGRRKARDLHGFFEATLQLAGTQRELTQYGKSHRLLTETFPLAMKEYGDNSAMESNFIYQFALLYRVQNLYKEAQDKFEKCLAIRQDVFGRDHIETMTARHNLAEVCDRLGQTSKADLLFQMNSKIIQKQEAKEMEGYAAERQF